MSMREKDSADFDLEAFIDLFDEALTSDDPSVQKTLQHLMVIAALARNHNAHSDRQGPMRRLYEDVKNLQRRLERLENGPGTLGGGYRPAPMPGTTSPYGPSMWPHTYPTPVGGGGPTPNWPQSVPIWTTSGTSATSITLAQNSAVSQSASSAGITIAERVDDLLKSNYKGSSVGTVDVKIS
jgi:hypothetical protein